MALPQIDPASFAWTPSDEGPWYDITYQGVHVITVLLVGLPEPGSEKETDLRAQLTEDLEERLAQISHHQCLEFWGRVAGYRS